MNGRSPQNLLRDTDGMGNPMGDFDPSADAGANPGAGVDAQPEYLNNKCSYPAFVGEKLYEYWAIIEMLYLLSTDANARSQFVENMQGSAAYHAMVGAGAGQLAGDQNMAAGSLLLWEYFGVVKKGTAEKMLNEAAANTELSIKHTNIAADKIAASIKEYVDAILKRYDDCGLLYAIATLSTDGVFFVADLALGAGAGALAVKGLKFVALRVAKTGAIVVTATSSAGGTLRRTFTREALETKYGKPQKNHMGVLEKDKNHKPRPGEKDKKVEKSKKDAEKSAAAESSATDRLKKEFPDADIKQNVPFPEKNGFPPGEIDTLVNGVPVETTIGSGKGKLSQLQKVENFTGQKPILYAPNVGGTVERSVKSAGYEVAKSLDELVEMVKKRRDMTWRR
jgi:hypothetical protein